MIGVALVCSSLTAIIYISLVARLTKNGIYYVAAYSAWFDLIFTIVAIGLAAATASVTGMLVSAFTGVSLTLMLIFMRRYLGGYKFKRVQGKWFKFERITLQPTHKLPSFLNWLQERLPTVDKAYA